MAEREIEKICEQIRQKWDVMHICVMHRLGYVNNAWGNIEIVAIQCLSICDLETAY